MMVSATKPAATAKAIAWIKNLTHEVSIGEKYSGKVTRLMDFGAFVEFLPGQEGMIHISNLANTRVNRVEDVVKTGDSVAVEVTEIDSQGRINLKVQGVTGSGGGERGRRSGGHPSAGRSGARRRF